MNCRECGASIPDDSVFCPECGQLAGGPPPATSPPPAPSPPPPISAPRIAVPNYLVQSILVTVFCCLPLGIVAIINAAQSSSKRDAGDHEGAMQAARKSKQWCWIAVGAGLVTLVVWVMFVAANEGQDF